MDASIFFSIAGASLVEQFYKKSCQPVAGAACYKLDDAAGTILTFTDSGIGRPKLIRSIPLLDLV